MSRGARVRSLTSTSSCWNSSLEDMVSGARRKGANRFSARACAPPRGSASMPSHALYLSFTQALHLGGQQRQHPLQHERIALLRLHAGITSRSVAGGARRCDAVAPLEG